MVDSHFYSFFGQNTGLIISSSAKSEPYIFMRFIKRKTNTSWEKPSSGEGKSIKFSLEEIILILQVLKRDTSNWTSYHSYKNQKTPISFSWEDKNANSLWINISNYSKMLNVPQVEILKLLLTHLLNEKIENATVMNRDKKEYSNSQNKENLESIDFPESNNDLLLEEISLESTNSNITKISNQNENSVKEKNNVQGSIKGETEKALLISFNAGNEIWIPKSTIHSEYEHKKEHSQLFLIDAWILKKNKIIS